MRLTPDRDVTATGICERPARGPQYPHHLWRRKSCCRRTAAPAHDFGPLRCGVAVNEVAALVMISNGADVEPMAVRGSDRASVLCEAVLHAHRLSVGNRRRIGRAKLADQPMRQLPPVTEMGTEPTSPEIVTVSGRLDRTLRRQRWNETRVRHGIAGGGGHWEGRPMPSAWWWSSWRTAGDAETQTTALVVNIPAAEVKALP